VTRLSGKQQAARLTWTRSQWIDEAQAVLGEAAIIWFTLKLGRRNGDHRVVRGLLSEFDRRLATAMLKLLRHPVRRKFDRQVACEQAITGMTRMLASLTKSVERQFEQGYGPVRRGLCDADVEDFLAKAREAAVLLGR
jgi:hypothetical protein